MYNLNTAAPSQLAKALLAAAFLLALLLPASVFAEGEEQPVKAPGGGAATAEELNQALGGNHEVAGNTVTLQADVNLEKRIDLKASNPLILNLNGKTVQYDKQNFYMLGLKSDLIIRGKGYMKTTGIAVSVIMLEGRCSLTIDDADIECEGEESDAIVTADNTQNRFHITLNKARIKSDFISLNGKGAVVSLEVNDTVIDGIYLTQPKINVGYKQIPSGARNKVIFNGGTILNYFGGGMCDATIKAGEIKRMYWSCGSKVEWNGGTVAENVSVDGSHVVMKGGSAKRISCIADGTFVMNAGIVAGRGIEVSEGRAELKGGTVRASDGEAIHLCYRANAVLEGGRIETSKAGIRGIFIEQKSLLTLKRGVIKSTASKSSSAGIYISGDQAKVTLEGTKKGAAYVKGYKYGLYRNGKAACQISKNTKVYAPKAAKNSYTKSKKLPKIVKGNITVKYKKL